MDATSDAAWSAASVWCEIACGSVEVVAMAGAYSMYEEEDGAGNAASAGVGIA